MWTTLRLFISGSLRRLVVALVPFLKTQAAKFTADYFDDARAIVKELAACEQLTGREKFDTACDKLAALVRDKCAVYRDHWLHTAIQAGYDALKEELEAAKKTE